MTRIRTLALVVLAALTTACIAPPVAEEPEPVILPPPSV